MKLYKSKKKKKKNGRTEKQWRKTKRVRGKTLEIGIKKKKKKNHSWIKF